MRKKFLSMLALCLAAWSLSWTPVVAEETGSATQEETQVTVIGKTEGEGYSVKIRYSPETDAPDLAAIVTRLHPSDREFVTVWNSEMSATTLRAENSAKAMIRPKEAEFGRRFQVMIAGHFDYGEDRAISVDLVFPDGTTRRVLFHQVDLRNFEVVTDFKLSDVFTQQ